MWGRPVAVVISGLALVLAACGGQVVPGEEKVRPKLPNAGLAGPSATSGAATSGGAESLLYPQRPVEYRLAPGIEPPARSAAAYRVVAEKVDGQLVTRLAEALGLDGEVEPSDEGTFTVQSGGRQLVVGTDSWNYFHDAAGSQVGSDVAVSCAPGTDCPAPPPPPPPVGVPSAAEAEKKALELLSKAGIDLRGAEAQVDQDDTSARTVSFVPQAGGREVVGLETSVTFGEHGRLEQASGFFGRFESVGEYPLIDLEAAVERHRAGIGGAPRALGDTPAAGGGDPEPAPAPAPAPASASASSQAQPEVVELTGVELVLEVVEPFCPGDTVYLVPTFAFEPDGVVLVPAVADEELAGADQSPQAPQTPCPGDEPVTVPPSGLPEPTPLPEPPPDIPTSVPPDIPTSVPPDMPSSVPSEGPPADGP